MTIPMNFRTQHLRRVPLGVAQAAQACSQRTHAVPTAQRDAVDELRPSWPPPGAIDLDLRLMDGARAVRITDVRTVAAFLDATSTSVLIEVTLAEMVEA